MEEKERGRGVLERLLGLLQIECQIEEKTRSGRTIYSITCPDNSLLIGYRGETLKALQYTANLVAKRQISPDIFIELDVGSYREEQNKKLEEYADRVVTKVINSGRAEVMRSMNSAERRIVHLVCGQHLEVECESVGEEPNRRVIVRSKKHGETSALR